MRFYIIIPLLMAFNATAAADLQELPVGTKAVVKATPFQQYTIQAQCARLAELAGLKRSSVLHLSAAKRIKPKELLDSDISYRYGLVDGRLITVKAYRGHTHSIEHIANAVYEKICPAMM